MTQGMVGVDPGRFDQQPGPRGDVESQQGGGSTLGAEEGMGV